MFYEVLRAGEGRSSVGCRRSPTRSSPSTGETAELTDAELRAKTDEFKERYADGESLDQLLPEAFAVVREAATRTLGQRHYRVQLMGGAALHLGNVAEMKTGEGKTLTGVLPAYLNALSGDGVHVVTTNDYLAQRDAEWMGRVHRFLGLSVGTILSGQTPGRAARAVRCATSRTARTTSSASTTCATTWRGARPTSSSAATPTRSSTRSTRS